MTTDTQKYHSFYEKMKSALNQHDLDAFLNCFDSNYQSEQPAHPNRQFAGKEQVQKNWSSIFSSIPSFRAELLRVAAADDVVWAEWDWQGTRLDTTRFQMRGVTIMKLQDDRIIWGRLYMEPVETVGPGIDDSVKIMTKE
jgi:ketosteroid isomerase-like protein